MERRRVLFSGRVQGVGFRETSRRFAGSFPVKGYVKNLSDGRVELVAEGDAASLDAFLGAIRTEFADNIDDLSIDQDAGGVPPFADFSIRY